MSRKILSEKTMSPTKFLKMLALSSVGREALKKLGLKARKVTADKIKLRHEPEKWIGSQIVTVLVKKGFARTTQQHAWQKRAEKTASLTPEGRKFLNTVKFAENADEITLITRRGK